MAEQQEKISEHPQIIAWNRYRNRVEFDAARKASQAGTKDAEQIMWEAFCAGWRACWERSLESRV